MEELLTQRVMGMALGYEDANDAARLACDPVHKLLVGRDPIDGEDLASQPTLSRFENAPDRQELLRMERGAGGLRHRAPSQTAAWPRPPHHHRSGPDRRPHARPATVHLFNSHYDSYCYLPMVGFLTFNDEAEQYLVAPCCAG